MLVIKAFPHKHKCHVRGCKNLNVFTIGEENEHPAYAQFYCKDTLLEMADAINHYFESNGETKRVTPAELQAKIDELTIQNEELQKQAADYEQIKTKLESEKASGDLFKEQLGDLEAENEKLKKENRSLKKKVDAASSKNEPETETKTGKTDEGTESNGNSN
jgi:organic radical activating enzyme